MSSEKINIDMIREAEEFVKKFFRENMPDEFNYHTLQHTERVVGKVKEIAPHTGLNDDEINEVVMAAWFHDLGYHKGPKGHETESIRILKEFLTEKQVHPDGMERISNCVLATQMPPSPSTLQEKVLADADLLHIGTQAFFEESPKIREEFEKFLGRKFGDREWLESNIHFFKMHTFFTEYAAEKYGEGKAENFNKIKKELKALKKMEKPEKSEKLESKKIKPDRGRETMFRITSRNHLELSNMADNKANIMISVNAIMLSIIVSMLIRKLDSNPYLVVPTLILVAVCLATIIFAIRATRPNISSGKFTREDIRQKRTNLLFFGNFHRVSLEDFDWGMQEMIKDSDYLYSSMIKDIYYLGVILGKKYRNLRIAYTIFMYGFAIAIISYVVAFINSGAL